MSDACDYKIRERLLGMRNEVHALLLVDGLELDGVVCVLPPACGASTVKVFLDVMPTETTNLKGLLRRSSCRD